MRAKLIALRKKKKFKQHEIAKVLGISRGHYAAIETGHRNPTIGLAYEISEVLGYNIDPKGIFKSEVAEGVENND